MPSSWNTTHRSSAWSLRERVSRSIDFVDTTTRDGNQSLWSATGLTTPDVLAIAPTLDRVGYHALDFTSSTHMAVSVRFHREDPWERIRLVSEAMPETPLGMITTGMRFISWVPADEEVMRLSFRLVVRNGLRRLQIADPSNDPTRLKRLAAMARAEGFREVVVGLTYSISEVHTHAYYAERVAALAECAEIDRLYLKDRAACSRRRPCGSLRHISSRRPVGARSSCTVIARSGWRRSCTSRAYKRVFRSSTRPPGRSRAEPRSRRW